VDRHELVEDKRTDSETVGKTKKNYVFENFVLLENVETVALEILVKLVNLDSSHHLFPPK